MAWCWHLLSPIDSLKAQTQFQLKTVWNRSIIKTLYRGYGLVLASTVPLTATYFISMETSKKLLPLQEGPVKEFLAGVLAQTMASVMFTPRDVIKERMQVQHLQNTTTDKYDKAWDALKFVWKTEGAKGLFRGYFQTLTLWSLYGGVRQIYLI
eukprot:TRINITY_DN7534_c0_g1_i2.p1 TRINITY_DN7534_c0_g1~~TRINITY_DN7534_c0_g1_i2.p1  ORF type:complete len:153 (+),score=12.76 TRINITY_DN7534_c0_g1_i2:181-639(+)